MDLNEMAEELKVKQSKPIYNAEDFEERLSELTIGTEDVQQLMIFVRRKETTVANLLRKISVAERIIGEYELDRRLIEDDYE